MTNDEKESKKITRSEAIRRATENDEEILFATCPCCNELLAVYIKRDTTLEPADKRIVN